MIPRRDFVKGSTAALAATLGIRTGARASMAPPPEKPRAWKGFASFEEIPLPNHQSVSLVVAPAKKKVLKATSLDVYFSPGLLKANGELVGRQDLDTAWPVDVRYDQFPRTEYADARDGNPYWTWQSPPEPNLTVRRCLGQHLVAPRHHLCLEIAPVRIDRNKAFNITIANCGGSLIAFVKVGLEEILPSSLEF